MERIKMEPVIFVGEKDFDEVGFKLQNTLIVGRTCTGKTTVLNNILLGLLRTCNPEEYCIDIIDIHYQSIWNECVNKKGYNIPAINSVVSLSEQDAGGGLTSLLKFYSNWMKTSPGFCTPGNKKRIVVVDEFQFIEQAENSNEVAKVLNELLLLGPSLGVYFIVSYGSCVFGKVMSGVDASGFSLRIGTAYQPGECVGLFHTETQYFETKERENRYSKDVRAEEVGGKCVYGIIPRFKPMSFIKKMCRAYSIGKKDH